MHLVRRPAIVGTCRRSPPYDRCSCPNSRNVALSARATNIAGHVENMPCNVCKTPTHHTRSNEATHRVRDQLWRTRPSARAPTSLVFCSGICRNPTHFVPGRIAGPVPRRATVSSETHFPLSVDLRCLPGVTVPSLRRCVPV